MSIPPPPPGYAPNAAQIAAMKGQTVSAPLFGQLMANIEINLCRWSSIRIRQISLLAAKEPVPHSGEFVAQLALCSCADASSHYVYPLYS